MNDHVDGVSSPIWFPRAEYERLVRSLRADNTLALEIDGDGSVETLFRECRERLPLDPPISGRVHWDALADSLWSGLNALDAESIALVWRGAGQLEARDQRSFSIAEDVFLTAAAQLSGGSYGATPGKIVRVFFERV